MHHVVMAMNVTEETIQFFEEHDDERWHRVVPPGGLVQVPKKMLKDLDGLEEV